MSKRTTNLTGFVAIHIDDIHPNPGNPRDELRQLEDLADSIKAQGILEPLIVMEHPTRADQYQLLAGHRRLAAADLAGVDAVPCIVRSGKTPAQALEFALVENGQRADLDPIEEAHAIKQLKELAGINNSEVARRMGRSNGHVSARLSLLALAPTAQAQVKAGTLGVFEAYEKARAKTGKAGSKPWMESYFGLNHPLAAEARHQCEVAHRRTNVKLIGKQACARCWEAAIRQDERARVADADQLEVAPGES